MPSLQEKNISRRSNNAKELKTNLFIESLDYINKMNRPQTRTSSASRTNSENDENENETSNFTFVKKFKKEGKQGNIIEKILVGKVKKYYKEVCLLKQEYIKDDKKTVEDILGDIKIEKFIRFSLN